MATITDKAYLHYCEDKISNRRELITKAGKTARILGVLAIISIASLATGITLLATLSAHQAETAQVLTFVLGLFGTIGFGLFSLFSWGDSRASTSCEDIIARYCKPYEKWAEDTAREVEVISVAAQVCGPLATA